jgi:hypothetical protein
MNQSIIKTQNALAENKKEKSELLDLLLSQHKDYYKEQGIEIGSVVTVGNENGILAGFYIQYDEVLPRIMKIKKDGTAHASAGVYCWKIGEMKKAGAN